MFKGADQVQAYQQKPNNQICFRLCYGRNGEAPVAIVAPSTPADCFYMAIEASRMAIKYMVPVMYLSDGYIANGSEPWKIPDPETIPKYRLNLEQKKKDFAPYIQR